MSSSPPSLDCQAPAVPSLISSSLPLAQPSTSSLPELLDPPSLSAVVSSFTAPPALRPAHVHVPQELVDLVISQAAQDAPSLAAWCRVDSAALKVAGPLLYEEVRLDERNWEACLRGKAPSPGDSPRVTHALSFASLRHLSVPQALLPLLSSSSSPPSLALAKLFRTLPARPRTHPLVLSVLDPKKPTADAVFDRAAGVLALVDPDAVLLNLRPFAVPASQGGVGDVPLGIVEVLEEDVLQAFRTASLASQTAAASSSTADAHSSTPAGLAQPRPLASPSSDADAGPSLPMPSFPSAPAPTLEHLACESSSAQLASSALLIQKIQACLAALARPSSPLPAAVVRAFYDDMRPCERAFERRSIEVPLGADGRRAVRVPRSQPVAQLLACHALIDWWMTRLGQPALPGLP